MSILSKYTVLVPLAGKGQRMIDGGYVGPKPLIMAGNKYIIDWTLSSLELSNVNLVFIVRRDHVDNFSIDKILQQKFGNDITIVIAEKETRGATETCLLAEKYILKNQPFMILCSDIYFEPKFNGDSKYFDSDGFLLTFKANSPNYSYIKKNSIGLVEKVAEKLVISDEANVGVYCFKTGEVFLKAAKEAMLREDNKELYIAPLYNSIINSGGIVKTELVETMYIMGTPTELEFFKKDIFWYFLPKTFILCSDHSGYLLKEETRRLLEQTGKSCIDCGCYTEDDCDYADYVDRAVATRSNYPGAIILAFCRSGQGVNISANKHKDIRSALVHEYELAALAIRHNAVNCFAIPAGWTGGYGIESIIRASIETKFEGGRHQNRLMRVAR